MSECGVHTEARGWRWVSCCVILFDSFESVPLAEPKASLSDPPVSASLSQVQIAMTGVFMWVRDVKLGLHVCSGCVLTH